MGSMSLSANRHLHKTPNVQKDAGDIDNSISMKRISQIEKIIGANLIDNHGDTRDQSAKKIVDKYDEMIRLLKAFDRVTDPSVRADLLTLVEAATDSES